MKLLIPLLVLIPTQISFGNIEDSSNSHIPQVYHISQKIETKRVDLTGTEFDDPFVGGLRVQEVPEPPKGHWVTAVVTAYSPHVRSCEKWTSLGITAAQTYVRSGDPNDSYGYAVDPRAIPYGTKIFIPEYWDMISNNKNHIPTAIPEADDTGGALRKSWDKGILHIDVRFRQESTARKWGVKKIQVFIYE